MWIFTERGWKQIACETVDSQDQGAVPVTLSVPYAREYHDLAELMLPCKWER